MIKSNIFAATIVLNIKAMEEKEKLITVTGKGNIHVVPDVTKYKGRTSVPDPYYGDGEDFELTLDLIEDGCRGMPDGLPH
jgi:protein-tyrosine-phosphatase